MSTQHTDTQTQSEISGWQKLRRFPKPVWFLIIGTFLNRAGFFVLPYMALYLSKLGYSIEEVAFALASYGFGTVVASIVGGHLADTLGRRNTIVISMFGCAIAMIWLSQVEELYLFSTLAFLAALFSESYRPASHALIADLIDDEDRVIVYATLRWAINAGWAIGPALAGVLSQISYFWIFFGDALTSVLFGILALRFLPQFGKHREVPISHVFKAFSSLKRSLSMTLSDNRFLQVFIASFPIAFIFNQTLSSLSIEVRDRGYDEFAFGLLLGFNGVIIILTEIPLSLWVAKKDQKAMMIWGYALIGMGFGCFALSETLWSLYLGMAIFTVGEMIALPVALAYMSKLAPPDMRGRYMGVWGLSWSTTMMLSTSGGLKVHQIMGQQFWILTALLGVVSAVIMIPKLKD